MSWFYLLRFIVFWAILYVWIPRKALAFYEDESRLDRIVISFVTMAVLMNVGIQVLALFRLYDPISGIVLVAAAYLLLRRVSQGQQPGQVVDTLAGRLLASILDASERPQRAYHAAKQHLGTVLQKGVTRTLRVPLAWWLLITGMTAFAVPVYLRFHHAMTRLFMGASDVYVHLAWAKYMGLGRMYQDGVYPHGFHAFLSSFEKITFFDLYWVLRYTGPIVGTLLVASVGYTVYRFSGSAVAALLGSFVYGVGFGLPLDVWRQISSLPMEYAMLFMLPGLVFLLDYIQKQRSRYLYLFLGCYYLAFTSHPYAAVYLVLGAGVVWAMAILQRRVSWKQSGWVLVGGLVATLAGWAPLFIGRLQGIRYHSLEWALSRVDPVAPPARFTFAQVLLGSGTVVRVAVVLAMLLTALGLLAAISRRWAAHWPASALAAVTLALFIAYEASRLGLPSVMEATRTGTMFSLLAGAVVGLGPGLPLRWLESTYPRVRPWLCIALVVFMVYATSWYKPSPPRGYQLEYDVAVECYLRIRREFLPLTWTIVAPIEQYQQVLGRGWHLELLRYVMDLAPEEVVKPGFQLPIRTQHVFVFVEKVPLGLSRGLLPEDFQRPLPLEEEDTDPTTTFYRRPLNRAALQARALLLTEAYREHHPGVSIYYEDEILRVYHIVHDPRL